MRLYLYTTSPHLVLSLRVWSLSHHKRMLYLQGREQDIQHYRMHGLARALCESTIASSLQAGRLTGKLVAARRTIPLLGLNPSSSDKS